MRWSLLVAGEAALVIFLLTWGNSFTDSLQLHRAQLGILAVLGAAGWLTILHRPSRLPILLIVAPLPLLASLAITSIASAYPSLSWFATWQCAAYVGIAWLLAIQASHPVGRRNLVAAMGIVVTVVVGIYFAQVARAWVEWLSMGFPLTSLPLRPEGEGGLVQLPTWIGDVIALCGPIVAVWLWIANKRGAAVALAVAGAAAIVVSGTRSLLLLAVVASIVGAALAVRDRASRRVALVGSLAAVGVVVAGLTVVLLAGRSFDEGRASAYASAIDRFASSPIGGSGPGTYGVLRMGDAVDAISHLAFPDAHNLILTTAAESGVTGLLGLASAVILYAVAVWRAWRRTDSGRPIIVAAVLGIAVVAGHAMGEVVFALIGVVLLVIAAISIAVTDPTSTLPPIRRSRRLDALLLGGVALIVLTSTVIARNELASDAVAEADQFLSTAPGAALVAARRATDLTPDSVPAWWVRMNAADAASDATDAILSARRSVQLEGFGQEWISLGVLLARNGDRSGATEAIDRVRGRLPVDPVVELNTAILDLSFGADDNAVAATRRLLTVRPDIEPVLRDGPSGLDAIAHRARPEAVADLLAAGDFDSALLVALSGEDRDLATSVVDAAVAHGGTAAGVKERIVTEAWFGDEAARAAQAVMTAEGPNASALGWAWRLAARACDRAGMDHWGSAIEILVGRQPVVPIELAEAPGLQARLLPSRYPGVVWRIGHPERPYVGGMWTFTLDRPRCGS